MISPITLIVATAAVLLRRWQAGAWVPKAAAALVIAVLSVMTWQQTSLYENEQTLWVDTLKKNPNAPVAHNNLGLLLLGQGKLNQAMNPFPRPLQHEPTHDKPHMNLGYAQHSDAAARRATY